MCRFFRLNWILFLIHTIFEGFIQLWKRITFLKLKTEIWASRVSYIISSIECWMSWRWRYDQNWFKWEIQNNFILFSLYNTLQLIGEKAVTNSIVDSNTHVVNLKSFWNFQNFAKQTIESYIFLVFVLIYTRPQFPWNLKVLFKLVQFSVRNRYFKMKCNLLISCTR